jgi:RND superfamily putative drug exporter
MERWTRFVLRHRLAVVVLWLAVFVLGGYASSKLSPLLSNTFTVPGTDSERTRALLEQHFGDRPDGSFTVVFTVPDNRGPALLARLQRVVDRAARAVPTGRPTRLLTAGRDVVYGDVVSTLKLAEAKGYSDALLEAVGTPSGVERAYVTGAASIQRELDPIFNRDLAKGEAIAIPIALLVLLAVFGISASVTIPFIFAACTIAGTLGIIFGVAHLTETPTYTTNLVQLIGLAIAVDYSLLMVYRFREELLVAPAPAKPAPPPIRGSGGPTRRGRRETDDAVVRTMETAGRAVMFSGMAVALGLALLLAMPLPFMRMMGVAGFLIPVVSIAAAATLQPVLLSLYGRRGVARKRILPGEPIDPERGFWARLARGIMARPVIFLVVGASVLVAAALPAFGLQLTPGSTFGIPRTPQSVQGFDILRDAVGPGAVSPTVVLVSAKEGTVLEPRVQEAVGRLAAELAKDPEVAAVAAGTRGRFVDQTRRFQQVIVAGRHDYGFPEAQGFVDRLRGDLLPAADFPPSVEVTAGGGPAQGVDFLDRAYTYFPPLIAAVLLLTYVLLVRAFRSLLLPLKAIVLNLLSVAAAYGMLVVVFKWGVGEDVLGLYQFDQVEGWIPIFLFAMLFGLSMDYEVFLVSRMREAWDEGADNATAVAHGLERTGRIITAAAVIMCAAFSGFVAGRIVGLQQFGLGLAVAVLFDATVVRSVLVPSMMALFGRWNGWLPAWAARIVRVEPSPLVERGPPALRPAES